MSNPQKLIESYYRAWFRYHPESAVDLGVEGYADQLRPCGDDDIGALTTLNKKLLSSLDELETKDLPAAQRTDMALMRGAALLELKELVERDWRLRDPTRFVPVHAIYQLTLRPVENLQAALEGRLAAIPGYLRGAQAHLRTEPEQVPPIWLEAAQTEATQGAEYFRGLRKHPTFSKFKLAQRLDHGVQALEDFARFLEREIGPRARGDFACGKERFELLLRQRHFLNLDADSLHTLGQRLFAGTMLELQQVTKELRGDEDIAALAVQICGEHPTPEEMLARYRTEMEAARHFVVEHDLLTIPPKEQLKVVETPVFLRHQIPFAAYHEPPPTDSSQQGYYYVTPTTDEDAMGEHNITSIRHTCVHEAWPGHHLQFVTANQRTESSTLPRLLNPSATLYEGWALYCEQLMQEEGFLSDPVSRFVLLKDRLWRALRITLDVELHTRGLPISEAADRMQTLLGFTRQQAMADLNWYSQSPTIPMGYATGWALICATRDRLRSMSHRFDLKTFHDKLLSSGSIALPLAIRSAFGEPLWESVRRAVFEKPTDQPAGKQGFP